MGRYVSRVVVDSEGVPLQNAVGQVFAISDTENTSPLDIYDAGGSSFSLDELKSNGDGVTPEFNTPGQPHVKWVSGPYTVDMLSWDTIPDGGGTGQVLAKNSDDDYDLEWVNQGSGLPEGGTDGQILVKEGSTNYAAHWVTKFVVIGPSDAWPTGLPDGTIVVRSEV